MRIVRIWFEKTGMSRYISHLDLMRTMTRAIRRSKIPLWYTEGFNPHPYMAFTLPLSLGMESRCESMDIKIEGEITNDEIFSMLCPVMPDGLTITKVTDPVLDPKFVCFGKFEIEFETENGEELSEKIKDMLSQDELIVQKLGKKGHRKVWKDINLIEFIHSYEINITSGSLILSIVLPAGSATNVNPDLLAKKIAEEENLLYIIRRKDLLTKDMKSFS